MFETADTRATLDRDGVVELVLTQARPAISEDVLGAIDRALDIAESDGAPLVIAASAEHFAFGANLDDAFAAAADGRVDVLERALDRYQRTMLRLRDSRVPTVAAVRGVAVSGGCELLMHSTHVVVHPRCAIGLAEATVGVIPGGGGLKELALRAAAIPEELTSRIEHAFDTVAAGRIAIGIDEARALGFLDTNRSTAASDPAGAAKRIGLELRDSHRAPARVLSFRVAGSAFAARLIEKQRRARDAGAISDHQLRVDSCVAYVLCGGDEATGIRSEAQILALEREKFLELACLPPTQARLSHLRETGVVLRN